MKRPTRYNRLVNAWSAWVRGSSRRTMGGVAPTRRHRLQGIERPV